MPYKKGRLTPDTLGYRQREVEIVALGQVFSRHEAFDVVYLGEQLVRDLVKVMHGIAPGNERGRGAAQGRQRRDQALHCSAYKADLVLFLPCGSGP